MTDLENDNAMTDDDSEVDFEHARQLVDQRQVFRRRPKTVANVLGQLMAHRGIAQQQTNDELERVWAEIVGKLTADHCRLGNIRRGVLEIYVDSPMLSQQLTFQKTEILQQLQNQLTRTPIRELRFRLGSTG